MRRRNKASTTFISLIVFLISVASSSAQEPGGRVGLPGPTKPKITRPTRTPVEPRAKAPVQRQSPAPVLLADLTVTVTPSDARIWLNEQEVESRERDGSLRLRGLKPGILRITARKPNYRDYERTINLAPQQSENVNVLLVPLPGFISVAPSVEGAVITLTNKEQGTSFGPYRERLSRLEVPAGTYQLSVTKSGYKDSVREVDIGPAATLYLEPQLESLPVERAASRHNSTMRLQTLNEGKNMLVILTGASGDSSGGGGTLEVSLPNGMAGVGSVTGALPGAPCEVDFVRLENVGEYSFSEPPALSNGWERVVVRVRPKSYKRPIRFAINWRPIREASTTGAGTSSLSPTEDAVPVQKILPNYPQAARTSRMSATVLVKVEIDERGNVVSARAIEGPGLFRTAAENAARQWKFSPAKRDGRPVSAIQTIQFNFNPQF